MFHDLPDDIIDYIIDNLFDNNHPIELLELRNINKKLRLKIDNKKLKSSIINDDTNINKSINDLLRKNTNIKQIEWLLKNHVKFNLNHIRTVIIHNRIDIIKKGFHYQDFLKLIFNRFYLSEENTSDLYAATECNNPIIIASIYNRVDIVKLLIESSSIGNPYTKVLNGLLDIAVRYGHKNLFSYLVTYQYDSIKQLVTCKIGKIINRMRDCEDVFFYLVVNGKIDMDQKLLLGCITNNYYELFYYVYSKSEIKDNLELLLKTIDTNNYDIFNYLLNRYQVDNEYLTEIIIDNNHKEAYTKEFLYNIINNHIDKITKDSKMIYLCLINFIENDYIKKLIHLGYKYGDDEMLFVLSNKNIILLREMCNYYKIE